MKRNPRLGRPRIRRGCHPTITTFEVTPKLEARFWAKVDRRGPDECWNWTAATHSMGYGQMWVKDTVLQAHRIAIILTGGTLPPDKVCDHTCRNILCVNPAHIRFVSQRVNTLENNDNPFALNARKTECVRGHPFTPENTKLTKRGERQCITCHRMHSRKAYAKSRVRHSGGPS